MQDDLKQTTKCTHAHINRFAGQTKIEGAAVDQYGNAAGSAYDLAVDGGFAGLKIAVLHLYTDEGFDFSLPMGPLKQKGFAVHHWKGVVPTPHELITVLAESCQLWLISSSFSLLTDAHIDIIQKFFDDGHGVYIWGDNEVRTAHVPFMFLHYTQQS